MAIETILSNWGLLAVFIGAGVEGETVVVTSGALAHQGLLSLPWTIVVSCTGSFLADQIFFALGRHFRDRRWVQRMLKKPASDRALDLLARYPTLFILGFRFLYGLRTVSPIAMGTSNVRQSTFLALNALAAAVWGTLFTLAGYMLGERIHAIFGKLHSLVPILIGAIVLTILLVLGSRIARAIHHRTKRTVDGVPETLP